MPVDSQVVTLGIAGGPSLEVPWTAGMNVQTALERANDEAEPITFCLEYFSSVSEYFVTMLNDTYDTFASAADPFYYWELIVNGSPASKGIDQTILNAGDAVQFAFTEYSEAAHAGTTLAIKHERRSR